VPKKGSQRKENAQAKRDHAVGVLLTVKKDSSHRLAAILNGDVVEYSRHMSEDEVRTVRLITAYKSEISKLSLEYGGRIVEFAGDNVRAEFGSALNAVKSVVRIQSEIQNYNEKFPADQRMRFRIGNYLGDVMTDGERIYVEGVNIASRLESLSKPDGICISDVVHRQVRNKLEQEFEDLGEKTVKHIPDPVRVFRVLMGGTAEGRGPTDEDSKASFHAIEEGTSSDRMGKDASVRTGEGTTPETSPSIPEKPSLAVLPFVNLSTDPEQDYFADCLTMEIMTSLIKIPRFFLIADQTIFTFKWKPVSIREFGRRLGVRQVLEGGRERAAAAESGVSPRGICPFPTLQGRACIGKTAFGSPIGGIVLTLRFSSPQDDPRGGRCTL